MGLYRTTKTNLTICSVLFASFSQTSRYVSGEGPIVSTTVERLLRSFHGDVSMIGNCAWRRKRFEGFSCLEDIMEHFSSEKRGMGKTGFIFCIDELSTLRKKNPEECQNIMASLLAASQYWLQRRGFCAIVAAAISIHDFGEVVLQVSRRAFIPIQFPASRPEMLQKATDFVRKKTDRFQGSPMQSGDGRVLFACDNVSFREQCQREKLVLYHGYGTHCY